MQEVFAHLKKLESTMPIEEWAEASNAILLHTRGKGVAELLKKFRPSEPPEIQTYRVDNTYLYTREPFTKAIDAVKKSVKQVGVTYDIQEDIEPIVKNTRVTTSLGSFTLEQFFLNIFQQIIEYPNAHLVWLPINPTKNYEFTPPNHPLGIKSDTIKVSYEPYIAKKVLYFDNDLCIWEMGMWTYMSKGQPMNAPYYMGADMSGFYRHIPIGEDSGGKIKYETEPYYVPNNGLSQRPTRPLGGDLTSKDNKDYYVSFFANAAEFGRDFLSSYSDTKGVIIKNLNPIRVFNESICDSCNGNGWNLIEREQRTCKSCNGSGKNFLMSPYGDVEKKASGRRNEDGNTTPFVEYYSSGSELLEFNVNYCFEVLFPKIEDALCLNYVKVAQSGTAKEEDKESYYALLEKILDNYKDLMEFTLISIRDLLVYDVNKRKDVNVYQSRSVRGANTFDLITEISNLTTSNIPTQMKSSIIKQYLVDIKNKDERKILSIIADYDPLFGKSDADILQLTAAVNNQVSKDDMAFHLKGRMALVELSEKYEDNFLKMENKRLYEEAIQLLTNE